MKRIIPIFVLIGIFSCQQPVKHEQKSNLDELARAYVKLGLRIGMYDSDFVDAYYGPDSLKPAPVKDTVFPRDEFLKEASSLKLQLDEISKSGKDDTAAIRARWISSQLTAFERRIRIFSGERRTFDQESKELFGVAAPSYPESYFKQLIQQLDSLVPGKGPIAERFQALAQHFIIPKNKIDTVFRTAIAEARKRTLAHYPLPAGENFKLEFLTGKPWSGYNWYKGNFTSDIQINTDLDIFIERAIDVASHESYPGHHVFNMLLEKNLYRDKGWIEVSLYPLFSPQSLIAEGSANYGIEVAFPGKEKDDFAKNVLLPLASMDTTGYDFYAKALAIKAQLGFVKNEVGRALLDKHMSEEDAIRWLMEYGLSTRESAIKSISFFNKYGSYVINYNYGQDLVRNYIESHGGTISNPEKRWQLFGELLSNEMTPADLIKK